MLGCFIGLSMDCIVPCEHTLFALTNVFSVRKCREVLLVGPDATPRNVTPFFKLQTGQLVLRRFVTTNDEMHAGTAILYWVLLRKRENLCILKNCMFRISTSIQPRTGRPKFGWPVLHSSTSQSGRTAVPTKVQVPRNPRLAEGGVGGSRQGEL